MSRAPTNAALYINLHGKHLSLNIHVQLWPPQYWKWQNHTAFRAYRRQVTRIWGPLQWSWFDSRTYFYPEER